MKKLTKELMEWGKSFAIALAVMLLINVFITPTTVYSISMNPTLVEKDILIMQKTSNPQRGDIVSFKSNLTLSEIDIKKLNPIQQIQAKFNPKKNLIKRVIGMPGDSILIENETVYVNGEKINEPYLGSATIGEVSIESIPDNEYFLMGDNRSHSTDSRDNRIGTVSGDSIVGKSIVRIYPLTKAGVVE